MPIVAYVLNRLCRAMYRKDYRRLIRVSDVKAVQEEKLRAILAKNKDTEYGRTYGFSAIANADEYRRCVPLSSYEDYLESIEKIGAGEKNILTAGDVRLLELSSGSSSASKLIPYTEDLKEDFQRGLRAWICDLYAQKNGVMNGKSYWSVTPVAGEKQYSSGGIPIGFDDDAQYFGKWEAKLLRFIFAVDPGVAHAKSMEEFYRLTSLSLLACRNLRLISVWNPTFLMLILNYMKDHAAELLDRLPKRRSSKIRESLLKGNFESIWPDLKLISCWADAQAKPKAKALQEIFPCTAIQPKGLLATEGFVSFPLAAAGGSVLSVYSHYFEFISPEDEAVYGAHELKAGQQYEVVMTTSGGLYRYRIGDVVEVTGFYRSLPILRFIGKRDLVCDLYGEKLNAIFVKDTLDRLGIQADFRMLAPAGDRYVLYVRSDVPVPNPDAAFRGNFHYDYCRKLGQLKEMRVYRLTGDADHEYLDACVRRGQKLGNIKPPILSLQDGWEDIFEGVLE
jgi:hypothetical protein